MGSPPAARLLDAWGRLFRAAYDKLSSRFSIHGFVGKRCRTIDTGSELFFAIMAGISSCSFCFPHSFFGGDSSLRTCNELNTRRLPSTTWNAADDNVQHGQYFASHSTSIL